MVLQIMQIFSVGVSCMSRLAGTQYNLFVTKMEIGIRIKILILEKTIYNHYNCVPT